MLKLTTDDFYYYDSNHDIDRMNGMYPRLPNDAIQKFRYSDLAFIKYSRDVVDLMQTKGIPYVISLARKINGKPYTIKIDGVNYGFRQVVVKQRAIEKGLKKSSRVTKETAKDLLRSATDYIVSGSTGS